METSRKVVLALASRIADQTGATAKVLEALDICLGALERSPWPDVAWRFSRLTSDGCPVEFGFSTAVDELRVALEVAGPETAEARRIDAALGLIDALGLPMPGPDRIRGWRELQSGAVLRWGCWLGLRPSGEGVDAKLYIEAPRDRTAPPPYARAGCRLRMLGYDLSTQSTECYYAWPQVSSVECEHRLRTLASRDTVTALMTALERIIGLPQAAGIARARLGVSVADQQRGIAVFVDPRSVIGGASAIHRHMAVVESSYTQLLSGRHPHASHGILTLVPRSAGVELRTGLAADVLT